MDIILNKLNLTLLSDGLYVLRKALTDIVARDSKIITNFSKILKTVLILQGSLNFHRLMLRNITKAWKGPWNIQHLFAFNARPQSVIAFRTDETQ